MDPTSQDPAAPPPHVSARTLTWQLRTRQLQFPLHPLVMGIVNVTPDSFSDGGRCFEPATAIAHGLRLAAEGADLLDVGGESTRPYSDPVEADEELRRTTEVVRALVEQTGKPISIDTSKASVARAAIAAGAEIVNDVTALTGDPQMLSLVRETGAGVVLMHMQGTPQTMQNAPTYRQVVAEVSDYLRERRDTLLAAGIEPSRICLDPGIGFGKSHQHNVTLLAECWRLHELDCPVLVGHSRKGFIAKILHDQQTNRTAGTVGVGLALARQGVQVLRVHDVAPMRQALLLFAACGGIDGRPLQLDE